MIRTLTYPLDLGKGQTFNTDIARDAAGKLLSFAKFLSPIKLIPGVEPWGTLVEKTITAVSESAQSAVDMAELDLLGRKKAVQDAITELDRPIVVVIDDIDRLPPDEIRIIMQAVKAIADFDRVSYLLAYEPEPIIRALSYNNIYDGRRYLEKIVQASYPVPRVGYWHLKSFLNFHLKSLFTDTKIEISAKENEILKEALDTTAIVRSLSSPRDIIRLVNRLRVTARNICGEVNFADTLAFETLELKFPPISDAIRKHPEIFLKTSIVEGDYITQDHIDFITDDDSEKEEPPLIKELLSKYEQTDMKNIRSILGFIFPSLFEDWNSISVEESAFNNRISTKESLLKLLHCGITKYVYSSREIKHFLSSPNDRREILIDAFEARSLPGWLNYASGFTSISEIANPSSIIDELFNVAITAYREGGLNLTNEISDFVRSLIKGIDQYETRKDLIFQIASNRDLLSISEHILVTLLSEFGMWESGAFKGIQEYEDHDLKGFPIKPEDLVYAKDKWLSILRNEAKKRDIISTEPQPISIFFRWGQLNENNYTEVQEYIDKFTESGGGIRAFVECFHEGKSLQGIECLVCDLNKMIEKIDNLDEKPQFGSRMSKYFKSVIENTTVRLKN